MQLKIISRKYGEKIILIDDEDYNKIKNYKWGVSYNKKYDNFYVRSKFIDIHRLIMNCPSGMIVDHINHNGLDNRKENLRICNNKQNRINSLKHKELTSKYKGVYFEKIKRKYRADIRIDKKLKFIGLFKNEIDAAEAYNQAALKHFGQFANLNIIN